VIWTIIWEELVCKADIIKPHCVPHDSSDIDSLTEILCRLVDCDFFKQFLRAELRSSISYPMNKWRIRAWVQSHLRVNELHLPIKERSNVLEVIYALNHNTMWGYGESCSAVLSMIIHVTITGCAKSIYRRNL
jgi:hypothetical protein